MARFLLGGIAKSVALIEPITKLVNLSRYRVNWKLRHEQSPQLMFVLVFGELPSR